MPTLLLVPSLLLLISTAAAAATATSATTAPAHSNSKTIRGSVCTKTDRSCTACVKSNKKSHALTCTACSKGSVLIDNRCYCPAGSALAGSKPTTASASTGTKSSSAHSSKSKSKSGPPTCAPCAVNTYASSANFVTTSRCQQCPGGSTTRGATGSSTCYVEAGFYFDPLAQEARPCPDGYTCAGGDIFAEGQVFVDIDECEADESPCLNKGVCSNLPGTFSCDCSGTGYTDRLCETDINECEADESPCLNNGACSNLPGSFECNCDGTGFTNTICQTDIDECALSTPQIPACRNSGVCSNVPGSFSCDCQGTGYRGEICQTDIDECAEATPESPACASSTDICTNTPGSFSCTPAAGSINVAYYELSGEPAKLPDFGTLEPYLVSEVRDLNFAKTMNEFANSGRDELVGARFFGYINVPADGLWTFYLNSDDGSMLFIDENLLIDHDGLHMMTEKSGQVELTAGLHRIQVDYFEGIEAAGLIVSWSGPGNIPSKEPIPTTSFSPSS